MRRAGPGCGGSSCAWRPNPSPQRPDQHVPGLGAVAVELHGVAGVLLDRCSALGEALGEHALDRRSDRIPGLAFGLDDHAAEIRGQRSAESGEDLLVTLRGIGCRGVLDREPDQQRCEPRSARPSSTTPPVTTSAIATSTAARPKPWSRITSARPTASTADSSAGSGESSRATIRLSRTWDGVEPAVVAIWRRMSRRSGNTAYREVAE